MYKVKNQYNVYNMMLIFHYGEVLGLKSLVRRNKENISDTGAMEAYKAGLYWNYSIIQTSSFYSFIYLAI